MSMMYRIFFGILGTGLISGALFAFWARLFSVPTTSFAVFLALSVALGLALGFANYIFVKWVLRIFVNKFFTLEQVLVGTKPDRLGNVMVSNEIDEMEASMVRITEAFSALKSASRRSSSRSTLRAQQTGRRAAT